MVNIFYFLSFLVNIFKFLGFLVVSSLFLGFFLLAVLKYVKFAHDIAQPMVKCQNGPSTIKSNLPVYEPSCGQIQWPQEECKAYVFDIIV